MTLGLTNGINTFPVYTAESSSSGYLQSRGDYDNYKNLNKTIPTRQNPYPTDQRTIGIATDPTKSGIVGTVTRLILSVNIFKRTA